MNPILLDIPIPIETNRLIIRPPMPGDGPELNAAVNESFETLSTWLPWASTRPSLDDSEESARRSYANWILRSDLRLSIFDKASGLLVGGSGLHRANWEVPRFEIGYWVRDRFAGHGLITESTAAITQFAFEVLRARRVEIRCDSENMKSRSIPARLGYELECTLKMEDTKRNSHGLRDTVVFVRFNGDNLPDIGARWPMQTDGI